MTRTRRVDDHAAVIKAGWFSRAGWIGWRGDLGWMLIGLGGLSQCSLCGVVGFAGLPGPAMTPGMLGKSVDAILAASAATGLVMVAVGVWLVVRQHRRTTRLG